MLEVYVASVVLLTVLMYGAFTVTGLFLYAMQINLPAMALALGGMGMIKKFGLVALIPTVVTMLPVVVSMFIYAAHPTSQLFIVDLALFVGTIAGLLTLWWRIKRLVSSDEM
jgi:hypothetical protein